MFEKIVLPNGLRVIACQKASKAVSILVLVKNGSDYESEAENGISHFLEHMFFRGTRRRPTVFDISDAIERTGGIINAFTSHEMAGYYVRLPSIHFDLGLDVLSDIILKSRFDKEILTKERGAILTELAEVKSNAWDFIDDFWSEVLYGNQAAGRPIGGTEETVKNLGRADLKNYFKSHYVAQSSIICVAGGIPDFDLSRKIGKYFAKFPIGSSLPKQSFSEYQIRIEPKVVISERTEDRSVVAMGVRTPYHLAHPKRHTAALLGIILGKGMSSRLFLKIRAERGLAYDVSACHEAKTDRSYLIATVGIREVACIEDAISIILNEYKDIKECGVTAKELERARELRIGRSTMTLEDPSAMASYIGEGELLLGRLLDPEEDYARYRQVTLEDIQEVAQEIFRPENLNLAVVGPVKDDKPLRKIIEQF